MLPLGVLDSLHHTSKEKLAVSLQQLHAIETQTHQRKIRYQNEKYPKIHQALKTSRYEDQKNLNPDRIDGTGQWVVVNTQYRRWLNSACDDLRWNSAGPGCGKSVLAKSLIDEELQSTKPHKVCYFFFKDNEERTAERERLISYLIDFFKRISTESHDELDDRLKFLVTSRPYDDIHLGFNSFPSNSPVTQLRGVDETDKISAEINLVIKAEVTRLAEHLKLKPHTKLQIRDELLKMRTEHTSGHTSHTSRGKTSMKLTATVSDLSMKL
ncbi:uncharacterized protein A1O9_09314 [Exophiala aquamarina CBS 119918]|uniref:Nephrocystin 3-like N-terminal domain-containing protein n=1 Tax=Exophiala aquamarina CBS 119918 TaxID=1182545 RepID=A0A072P4V4_9EURO|nr:uncharacterized protein A1O9_09314 [Exophiala aquamarina CBS 119918]KEF54871.1 hypothetical protein A1O9_09314 [Exophiala aquamarina CBS 119918]